MTNETKPVLFRADKETQTILQKIKGANYSIGKIINKAIKNESKKLML